jgi:two-component system cell cycle response regulator DivK
MVKSRIVLNVEDNPENRLLIRRLLMASGYQVLEAESASRALELLKNNHPDLILMDMNMPDMDGYTLTNLIKAMPNFFAIPVVAITANVMRGDREKTVQAGCDGYIEKPINVDRFVEQIERYLH